MRQSRVYQRGDALAVLVVVLAVALIGALGFIFWQNFMSQDDGEPGVSSTVQSDDADKKIAEYRDLRTDGDTTGTEIAAAADIDKLGVIGEKLRAFLEVEAGKTVDVSPADAENTQAVQVFTIDRVYGDYATGVVSGANAYLIWGPKDGSGPIEVVAGSQNLGFSCDELTKAKVPAKLVDFKCYSFNGEDNDPVTYKQD